MATLFKPSRAYPLPENSEIQQQNGKPHVRIKERGKTVWYPLSEDGKQFLKPALKWVRGRPASGWKPPPCSILPNRDAAAIMLSALLKKIENEKIGIRDPFEAHRRKPLTDHLNDWETSLSSNGREKDYVDLKLSRVRAVVEGCKWVFAGDMTADRLETFLADLRSQRPDLPPMPEGTEWFTSGQVRELLGRVTRQTISFMIRRHQLTAKGRANARRFPRETVETLRGLKPGGCSSQTSNHYLQAVHQFARWLADNGRIDRSPFTRLKPLNARLDTRRRRGEMTAAELGALLATTEASRTTFLGLSGTDRAMLYQVAVGTGFRAKELAALVPDYFELDATTPAAVLPAEFTKNRKGAIQPLSDELVATLRTYLCGRSRKKRVWSGRWAKRAADMLRIDLQAANLPVEVDGPDGTETRDFHALRACYISNVIRAGADLKQAMTLGSAHRPTVDGWPIRANSAA